MYLLLILACQPGDTATKETGGADTAAPDDTAHTGDTTDSDTDCPPETWYADADGDTYGDPGAPTSACEAPPGTVADSSDCDDKRADVHPGAQEVCDSADVDEDCDGAADNDDPGATGASTWYADTDGDGYGSGVAIVACDAVDGQVANVTDCDSTRADVSPGGTEICDPDNVDEDCDGLADNADPDATGTSKLYEDADWDGYGSTTLIDACDPTSGASSVNTDCDDTEPTAHPYAIEVCDAADVDEDCDGRVDDDDTSVTGQDTWYRDADGDGFGATGGIERCDAPGGDYITDGGDCDDTRADVNDHADELCDDANVDEDCNGYTNDGDFSALGKITVWPDVDGDGYGAGTSTSFCDPSGSYVEDDTDCDDTRSLVHPGATEVCDASDLDEDCNGLADEADPGVDTSSAPTWYTDADGDGYGDPALTTTACTQPADHVAWNTDCDDTRTDIRPGQPEVCGDGVDDDCHGGDAACVTNHWVPSGPYDLDTIPCRFTDPGEAGGIGQGMMGGGDIDGDGFGDLVVTEPAWDDRGRISIFFGPIQTETTFDRGKLQMEYPDGSPYGDFGGETVFLGDQDGDGMDEFVVAAPQRNGGEVYYFNGATVTAGHGPRELPGYYDSMISSSGGMLGLSMDAGDFDGDGVQDLALGDPYYDTSNEGHAYVIYGPMPPSDVAIDTVADVTIAASYLMTKVGTRVAAGDVDGDGHDDLVVSSPDPGLLDDFGGAAWFYSGATLTNSFTDDAERSVTGNTAGDGAGTDISLGDWNGDGLQDLAMFTPGAESGLGAFTVHLAPWDGRVSDANVTVVGSGADTAFLTMLHDLDGDADDELVISIPESAYILYFYGGLTGRMSYGDAQASFYGTSGSDHLGYGLEDLGDIDGDGFHELGIGAPGTDSEDGKLWIVSGTFNDRSIDAPSGTASDYDDIDDGYGVAVAAAGDVNGDGTPDVLVGAPYGMATIEVGYAQLLLGGSGGSLTKRANFYGSSSGVEMGGRVAGGADLDGDAYDDMLIGGTGTDSLYIVYGGAALGDKDLPADADVGLGGALTCDDATAFDVIGDRDGDGDDAIVVGSSGCYDGGVSKGAVYAIEAPITEVDLHLAGVLTMYADDELDQLGKSVAGAGDVDGDGLKDFLAGAEEDDDAGTDAGSVWLVLGDRTGTMVAADADAQITGNAPGDSLGLSMCGPGDIDLDGYDDVVIGAPYVDSSKGEAYVFLGPVSSGPASSADVSMSPETGFNLGMGLATAGDVDGDGYADFLAYYYMASTYGSSAGEARVFHGPVDRLDDPSSIVGSNTYGTGWGDAVGVGDVDLDGFDDIAVSRTMPGDYGFVSIYSGY